MRLIPRPAQREAIPPAARALRKTGKALVVMATGLGKTLASAMIVKQVADPKDRRPGLFLVHNNDILERAMQEYLLVFPNARLGLFNGLTKKIEGSDIVFASTQAMHRNLSRFGRRYFKWIVCDEGHHFHARTFKQVIQHFGCPRFAVTATPDRLDMQDIRELFGPEVVNISLELAIARGWLPRIEYHLVTDSTLNETYLRKLAKQVLEDGERISLDEIKKRLFVRTREEKVAEIVASYPEKAAIFCQSIPHANHVSKLFPDATTYHSGNPRQQNRDALRDLRNGSVRRICTVNAFNEGVDVPDVGLVVFARSTQSETIFRQQLGRGLRPGKDKLVALDFAGNIERIRMIHRIVQRVAEIHEEETPKQKLKKEGFRREPFVVSGHGFEFTFSQQVVDVLNIFDKLQVDFYPTWQEASLAVQKLGISRTNEHMKRYQEDPRLPSKPWDFYSDYPGTPVFFYQEQKYPTWQEASKAAKKLGIQTSTEYSQRYQEDPRLPASPTATYSEYPGPDFFYRGEKKRLRYGSWQEASKAAKKLGIKGNREYSKRYKEHSQLPPHPETLYLDFPGWPVFLGTERYSSWQKAGAAAQKLKIKGKDDYRLRYQQDPRLPSAPWGKYSDFPGWPVFLGYKAHRGTKT